MPRRSAKSISQGYLKRWKTFNEKELLESYFKLDRNWSRKTINYVKDLVNLSEEQIYKWGYERKRKVKISAQKVKIPTSAHITRNNQSLFGQALDYNEIVSDLFPGGEWNSDKLTKEEKSKYDQLKRSMMKKDASIKRMSELDQILHERLPSDNLVSKNKTKSRRKTSLDEHSTFMEGVIKEEEARKSADDANLARSHLEDSKISLNNSKPQVPKFDPKPFDFLFPTKENLNFGDLPAGLFQDCLFLREDGLDGEF
ncbi:unnamed protein product [Moneuplotes crassus]|uniref:Homeobox domain-containing protein n=1 Tax=Euplotes crassus TaxID=5936 RepID=A0AAD1U082_EUPCR|nr:unnamed protein product [Moneuplotes crassus]